MLVDASPAVFPRSATFGVASFIFLERLSNLSPRLLSLLLLRTLSIPRSTLSGVLAVFVPVRRSLEAFLGSVFHSLSDIPNGLTVSFAFGSKSRFDSAKPGTLSAIID